MGRWGGGKLHAGCKLSGDSTAQSRAGARASACHGRHAPLSTAGVRLSFQSSFRFTATRRGRHRDGPYAPSPQSLPHYQHPHQTVHLLQLMNEPRLTRHHHPEPTVHIRVTLGAVHSVAEFCADSSGASCQVTLF